jgi:hypothetical protein
MDNFYCAVCYMLSLTKDVKPIRMQGRMVINGQSVCEVHSEIVLNFHGAPLSTIITKLIGRSLKSPDQSTRSG